MITDYKKNGVQFFPPMYPNLGTILLKNVKINTDFLNFSFKPHHVAYQMKACDLKHVTIGFDMNFAPNEIKYRPINPQNPAKLNFFIIIFFYVGYEMTACDSVSDLMREAW